MLYSSNIDVARDETGKDARFDHVPASRACRFLPNFYGKPITRFFTGIVPLSFSFANRIWIDWISREEWERIKILENFEAIEVDFLRSVPRHEWRANTNTNLPCAVSSFSEVK